MTASAKMTQTQLQNEGVFVARPPNECGQARAGARPDPPPPVSGIRKGRSRHLPTDHTANTALNQTHQVALTHPPTDQGTFPIKY